MPQSESPYRPLPEKHLAGIRRSRCVHYPGTEGCSCDQPHADVLPANNDMTAIPSDIYENMPGWTAQIQTRYYEQQPDQPNGERHEGGH